MFFVQEIDSSRMLENLVQLRIKQNTDSLMAPCEPSMAMLQLVATTVVECAATLAS